MLKSLSIVLALATALGCKTDNAPAPGTAGGSSGATTGAKGRSGKIELPAQRPALPTDDPDDDRGATVQSREERRQQRMAAMDTDGDGEVTDAERLAARAKRDAEIKARLDKDGDGTVSEAERAAARLERAEGLHVRLDVDNDGQLTAGELANAPSGRFDAVTTDDNGDGVISVQELDKAIAERGDRAPSPWDGRRRGGRGRPRGEGSGLPE